MTTTTWTVAHLATLVDDLSSHTAVIPDRPPRLLPAVDFWDLWPVREPNGEMADVCGAEVWAGLSAPASGHPGARHHRARIRLVSRRRDGWADLGMLFPDGASPGSREWAGSLVLDPATGRLSAYYTAAGERGEGAPTFRQRIMGASAVLRCANGGPAADGWSAHRELITADGVRYQAAVQATGEPGFIKAFRDPFFFHDPASQQSYLLFTGSMAGSATDFDGCVGIAVAAAEHWTLLDPLITADGVNNELERPHVVVHEGRYYLFFSTQQRTFHPNVAGPTGLYGFVASTLLGPYRPLNTSGLVLQNPAEEPFQAYSWLVLNDLRAVGFVDSFALHGRHPDQLEHEGAAASRRHFGGTMAPVVHLKIEGEHTRVAAD